MQGRLILNTFFFSQYVFGETLRGEAPMKSFTKNTVGGQCWRAEQRECRGRTQEFGCLVWILRPSRDNSSLVCGIVCVTVCSSGGQCRPLLLAPPPLQKWAALPDPPWTHGQSGILWARGGRGVFPGRGTDFSGPGPGRRVAFVPGLNDTAD